MKAIRVKYYWDSSIFLAWIKNEKRAHGEMDGVAEIAAMIDRREAVLVTSVLTKTEVLESSLNDRGRSMFDDIFKRRNFAAGRARRDSSDPTSGS